MEEDGVNALLEAGLEQKILDMERYLHTYREYLILDYYIISKTTYNVTYIPWIYINSCSYIFMQPTDLPRAAHMVAKTSYY